jgi:hypothetical protein
MTVKSAAQALIDKMLPMLRKSCLFTGYGPLHIIVEGSITQEVTDLVDALGGEADLSVVEPTPLPPSVFTNEGPVENRVPPSDKPAQAT